MAGSAGLATDFTLCGGCLFKENHYVYSKLWAAALRGGIISESWAINQLWGLATDLLPFRRVGGTEELGRKGARGADPSPGQCGNDSDPGSRKGAREVALRWRLEGAEGGVSMAQQSWDGAGRKSQSGMFLAKARLPGEAGQTSWMDTQRLSPWEEGRVGAEVEVRKSDLACPCGCKQGGGL